ncbi:MAG: bifunctional (p)ppGpp synthetase/guanosine-3',5'-bis(diphosphate) 3'-pyrophosphohydrolase [Ruminococcaceae bacterium]|nr:bifunctional (p)ppGpp synthetase/guanosine-3',5'-bis(diphosphate) 3'-pyrophosphohydrolase [Oscillospiraceae bacterium]
MTDNVKVLFEKLKRNVIAAFDEAEIEKIKAAFELAEASHSSQLRLSGEPYIIHPLSVALILVDMGMDYESVCAALLHDVVEDTSVTHEQVKEMFGESVAMLVDGVTKLGMVSLTTKEERQAENLRKMLIAMNQDIRVIIIKLADRVHNMRTLEFMSEQKRRDKSLETIEIYAPIAHRLGIRGFKDELEDLAIKFLDPVAYDEIKQSLENTGKSRNKYLEEIKERIYKRVTESVPGAHIEGRIKSVHGIYRKMYMQNKNIDEIYDIYAVRLIVDSVYDCYNCLGIIHDMYNPIPGRFKDYISTPKPNMYQSLHTTVIGKEGIPFEVQIRTWEMHQTAEYGIAAHWKYKLGMSSAGKAKFEDRLVWIRQLLEEQKDAEDVEDIVRTIKSDLVPEEVFVFTPKGDVINLPMGATIVDFAYAIHSAVGNKMVGAKVDGKIKTLDYVVNTGEIIEILTTSSQNKGPSRDWLKFAHTSGARTKIKNWFKKERREENIIQGKEEVEREFRQNRIHFDDEALDEYLKKLAERQRCNTVEDFYAAIGYGGISLIKLMPRIRDDYNRYVKEKTDKEPNAAIINTPPKKKITKSTEGIIVEGIDNCLIKFSKCCNPLPGDNIIGFITRGHGVSIHTRECPNVPRNISQANEPERWINAYWDKSAKNEYRATLLITCISRVGMLADLTVELAGIHVMLSNVVAKDTADGRCDVYMTITVNGAEHLHNVINKLNKINGVLHVERSGM